MINFTFFIRTELQDLYLVDYYFSEEYYFTLSPQGDSLKKNFILIVLLSLITNCSDNMVSDNDPVYQDSVFVTEIMYNYDEDNRYEFIELKNYSSRTADMHGFSILGSIEYNFDSVKIQPDSLIVLVKNSATFSNYFPATKVTGEFAGTLPTDSWEFTLNNLEGHTIQSINFDRNRSWTQMSLGIGYSLIRKLLPDANSDVPFFDWRPSMSFLGSPGWEEPPYEPITRINEYKPKTADTSCGFIEIKNLTDTIVNLGGWILTHSIEEYIEGNYFELPDTSTIAECGYLLLSTLARPSCENNIYVDHGFSFINGTTITLIERVNGSFTGYENYVNTPIVDNNESSGADTKEFNLIDYGILESVSMGDGNDKVTKIRDVIINEIMYCPKDDGYEYLELWNTSKNTIILSEGISELGWNIDGIEIEFPVNMEFRPNEKTVLARIDYSETAAFRDYYSVPDSTKIVAYKGKLKDEGEIITLRKGIETYVSDDGGIVTSYKTIDIASYLPTDGWPTQACGLGYSLERISFDTYGTKPEEWTISVYGGSCGR